MVNGIVTFGCCFWLQTWSANESKEEKDDDDIDYVLLSLYIEIRTINKLVLTNAYIHSYSNAKSAYLYLSQSHCSHLCMVFLQVNDDWSESIIFVCASWWNFFLVFSFIVVSGNTRCMCLFILYFGWLVYRIEFVVHLAFCLFLATHCRWSENASHIQIWICVWL